MATTVAGLAFLCSREQALFSAFFFVFLLRGEGGGGGGGGGERETDPRGAPKQVGV